MAQFCEVHRRETARCRCSRPMPQSGETLRGLRPAGTVLETCWATASGIIRHRRDRGADGWLRNRFCHSRRGQRHRLSACRSAGGTAGARRRTSRPRTFWGFVAVEQIAAAHGGRAGVRAECGKRCKATVWLPCTLKKAPAMLLMRGHLIQQSAVRGTESCQGKRQSASYHEGALPFSSSLERATTTSSGLVE